MSEFKYNDKGILEVWENGKKVGEIVTMGDLIKKDSDEKETNKQKQKKKK